MLEVYSWMKMEFEDATGMYLVVHWCTGTAWASTCAASTAGRCFNVRMKLTTISSSGRSSMLV
jgi:hypothetical protein